MPAALTPRAAPPVPVYLDTPVTELPVQVNSKAVATAAINQAAHFRDFFLCSIQPTKITETLPITITTEIHNQLRNLIHRQR